MDQRIKDMTQGNTLRLITALALPLMLGNVFQQLYTVTDTAIVGKALGVDALAALGVTDWLYWMLIGIVQGITQGFGILMAREFGARRFNELKSVVGTSVILSGISAIFLVIAGLLIAEPVLALLRTPAEIVDMSLLYLRIMFCGMPIVMAYNLLACILRALGDGKTPLYAMIIASLCNIALDLLFVLVFHWGIAGAAVATLIAQLLSCIFCFDRIRKISILKLHTNHYSLDLKLSLRLFGLGVPMAAQNTMIAIGGMIIQGVVNGYGVAFIGGFTASNKLYGVLEIAASSYGYAMTTFAGQNLGAKRIDRIRTGTRNATLVAIATSVVIAVIMLIFGRSIVGLFISGERSQIQQAIDVGYRYLSVMSICLPILYILHVTRSTIQGMGNTLLPMVSGIAEFIMRTGGVMILPAMLDQNGIFIAEVLAWAGAVAILVPSYFITVKRQLRSL